MMLRVVAQHTPTLYAILGLFEESECQPALQMETGDVYLFVARYPTWVLYRRRDL